MRAQTIRTPQKIQRGVWLRVLRSEPKSGLDSGFFKEINFHLGLSLT